METGARRCTETQSTTLIGSLSVCVCVCVEHRFVGLGLWLRASSQQRVALPTEAEIRTLQRT